MIIVTGGAGFIGSNIIKGLNERDVTDILVIDDLSDGTQFKNLVDLDILDYMDKNQFLNLIQQEGKFAKDIKAIFHQGACSTTTEWNGRFMMENNYEYSKHLLHYTLEREIPFIYASSAAVYGSGKIFKEDRTYEQPLNVYGYSKFLFDQYVRRLLPTAKSQIAGMRYFNVYGPREFHKGSMASVALHNHHQLLKEGVVKLFQGCDGYADGGQLRDFIFVGDVVAVNLWFMDHPHVSGIYNVGTGRAQAFNDISKAVIDWHNRGRIEYIPFPEHLQGRYQSFTQADISALRQAGCEHAFKPVEVGVKEYLDWIASSNRL